MNNLEFALELKNKRLASGLSQGQLRLRDAGGRTGCSSSQRVCRGISGTEPAPAGVQLCHSYGRGHAAHPYRFRAGGNGAEAGAYEKSIAETGVGAAGLYRPVKTADRMECLGKQ